MEPNGTNDNRVPTVLCRTGCGFYGSIACEGLCSKCYVDLVKSRQGGVTDKISCEEMTPNEVDLAASRVHEGIDADKSKSLSQDVYEAMRRASISEKDSPSTSSSDTPQPASNTSTSAEPTAERTVDTAAASIKLEPECDEATVTAAATAASDECSVETAATGECLDAKSKKKNRCHTCSKRVGLTGFACRCGGLYCSLHRYSDTHGCTFNYKELGQEDIRKNNPVVVSEKIRKI